jgi:hypothetical protein
MDTGSAWSVRRMGRMLELQNLCRQQDRADHIQDVPSLELKQAFDVLVVV